LYSNSEPVDLTTKDYKYIFDLILRSFNTKVNLKCSLSLLRKIIKVIDKDFIQNFKDINPDKLLNYLIDILENNKDKDNEVFNLEMNVLYCIYHIKLNFNFEEKSKEKVNYIM